MSKTNAKVKSSGSLLDRIERLGNKLPDPITLFLILSLVAVLASAIVSWAGVSVVNPANGETVEAVNLLSVYGLQYLWNNVISNFAGFAPLSMVLVAIIGSSVAEKSGFLVALMRQCLGGAKGWLVTMVIIFIGINLNLAGDAGFIILPPLAAVLYMSIGRSPLLGLYVAFASVSCGFCANVMLGMSDALAYGFTEVAAQLIDPEYSQSIAINWYFLIVSCIVLTVVGTVLVEKMLLRRFPTTKEDLKNYNFDTESTTLTPVEKKGLKWAGIAELGFVVVMLLLSLPIFGDTAILADETGSLMNSGSPFTTGIVFTVTLALMVPGVAYGFGIGKYKNDKDLWVEISQGFSEMGNYVFMCFFISIFTNFFAVSRIGTIIAIAGADALASIGLTGVPLMVGLMIVSCIVDLFIGSASAKWAILAPVFVPMMMLLGYDPAITQVVYRIGDSICNPLSPLFTYMPVIISYAQRYKKDAGMGTIIANMLPFSISFFLAWLVQLIVWVAFNLPLGPGGYVYLG